MMTSIGMVLGVLCVLITLVAHGGGLGSVVSLPAFMIVVGGSLGATLVGFGHRDLSEALSRAPELERELARRQRRAAAALNRYTMAYRLHGAARLEKESETEADPFLRAGLELIVQGTTRPSLEQVMELRIDRELKPLATAVRFFESLGSYAPTFGIVGTVLGLVGVLGRLHQPEQLAASMATAFVATFYGVLFANLVFLPLAARCRHRLAEAADSLDFVVVGLCGVLNGEAPRLLNERLCAHSAHQPARVRAVA